MYRLVVTYQRTPGIPMSREHYRETCSGYGSALKIAGRVVAHFEMLGFRVERVRVERI